MLVNARHNSQCCQTFTSMTNRLMSLSAHDMPVTTIAAAASAVVTGWWGISLSDAGFSIEWNRLNSSAD